MTREFRPEIYAIDFGTTNSLLAAANADEVHAPIALDPSAPDPSILRSVLYFPDADACLYGGEAIEQYVVRSMDGRLIRSIKKHLPSRAFVGTYIGERPMNLEDLIGAFLREMRVRADRFFGVEVRRVVVGRPARFSSHEPDDRYAEYRLERAARIAGFRDISFCPEPVAAARDFRSTLSEPKLVLVGDFGGGTSDFTVMRMRSEGYDASDVLAVGGISVAGDAYDSAIMRHHVARHFGAEVRYRVPFGSNVLSMPPALMEKICSPADASLLRDQDAMRFLREMRAFSLGPDDRSRLDQLLVLVEDRLGFRLFEAIGAAKHALSEHGQSCVRFSHPGIEVVEPVTREAFTQSSRKQTSAIVETLDATLEQAGVRSAEIDLVCCTGGTARVPALAAALAERFGVEKLRQFRAFHSVIAGLALHAQELCRAAS